MEPVTVAADSLPSSEGFAARSEASAPVKPSPVACRESHCDEPMDFESSVSTPRANVSDRAERTSAPPDPTQQGITIRSSNTTGAAPQEQHLVEKSAAGCVRQNRDSGAISVSYSCMDYQFYHSDGTRRVQPLDVDVPTPAVPQAIMYQGAAIKHIIPDRAMVDPSVRHVGSVPRTEGLGTLSPMLKPRMSLSTTMESRPSQYQVELLGMTSRCICTKDP